MNNNTILLDPSLLAEAVEATQASFIIADHTAPDDPIIYCNTAFERLTGYSREEILGHNCRFLQRDDQDQPVLKQLSAAITGGYDCTMQLRNYRKDGSFFLNELTIFPVRDADGIITHLIGVQRNISDAQQLNLSEEFHHEWRTPLTIIRSTLQLLERRGITIDPAFLAKSLNAAIRAVKRLEQLGHRLGL